jgi:hypothetical protein
MPDPESNTADTRPQVPRGSAGGKSFDFGPILRALLPFILGGGSVFSVVQWAVSVPQERQIYSLTKQNMEIESKLKAQQMDLENEARKLQNEAKKLQIEDDVRTRQEKDDESRIKVDREMLAMKDEVIRKLEESLARQKAHAGDPEYVAFEIAFREEVMVTAGLKISQVKARRGQDRN